MWSSKWINSQDLRYIEKSLIEINDRLASGASIKLALEEQSIFSDTARWMIHSSGENLVYGFEQVGEYYLAKSKTATDYFMTVSYPLSIMFVAGMVVFQILLYYGYLIGIMSMLLKMTTYIGF